MIKEAMIVTTNRLTVGPVLWFTGLSCSGKTTTAKQVAATLHAQGYLVEMLDGDELRETLCKGLGFSKAERMENIKRIAYVAKLLSRNGIIVVVSAITPYQEMRDNVRNNVPGFVEIYVDCPLELCERRDVKGLYAKARRGELAHFTGISDPYEPPLHPEIIINTAASTLEQNCNTVLSWLNLPFSTPMNSSKG
jgi:adenylylsulfate kinase